MPIEREGRRLCADKPDGIPHLVDQPRAKRCDQHREQRHRWSDANRYRKANGQPPLPWEPEPLTLQRRREALNLFADQNAVAISQTATHIVRTTAMLRSLRGKLEPADQQHLDVGLARIDALSDHLQSIAKVMGWPHN